ncbi:MAG: hypothetical protein ACRC5Q_02765 [Culicoidibacterales bacterium]
MAKNTCFLSGNAYNQILEPNGEIKTERKGNIQMPVQTFQATTGTVEKPTSLQIREFREKYNLSDQQIVDLKFEFKCKNGLVIETATLTYAE